MRNVAVFPLLLLAAACSRPQSPFVRIYAEDGRVYYARMDRALYTEAGGFLTFRDLVTKEQVRLPNGTYQALECPPDEVKQRQIEYLNDPTRPPRAEDYEQER